MEVKVRIQIILNNDLVAIRWIISFAIYNSTAIFTELSTVRQYLQIITCEETWPLLADTFKSILKFSFF